MRPRIKIGLLIALLSLQSAGCVFPWTGGVRRRLTVRTQPPGASVYVDNQYVGVSPTATPVTYYATREIQVVKDGYRTETVLRKFNPPWYQFPPLDFVTDTLWPKKIRDERIVDITMVPQQIISSDELQARANGLRIQAAQGVASPLPPTVAPSTSDLLGGRTDLPRPIDPTFPGPTGEPFESQPRWQPGQFLRDFVAPEGNPPTRVPETGILPGGGYRPEIESPQ